MDENFSTKLAEVTLELEKCKLLLDNFQEAFPPEKWENLIFSKHEELEALKTVKDFFQIRADLLFKLL